MYICICIYIYIEGLGFDRVYRVNLGAMWSDVKLRVLFHRLQKLEAPKACADVFRYTGLPFYFHKKFPGIVLGHTAIGVG